MELKESLLAKKTTEKRPKNDLIFMLLFKFFFTSFCNKPLFTTF